MNWQVHFLSTTKLVLQEWQCPRLMPDHPNENIKAGEQGEVVYRIQCENCWRAHIGEMGLLLRTPVEEHKKDCNNVSTTEYTRSNRKLLESIVKKSASTNHTTTRENHIIDWEGVTVVAKESNRRRRHMRKSIWIRMTSGKIKKDDCNYDVAHI